MLQVVVKLCEVHECLLESTNYYSSFVHVDYRDNPFFILKVHKTHGT